MIWCIFLFFNDRITMILLSVTKFLPTIFFFYINQINNVVVFDINQEKKIKFIVSFVLLFAFLFSFSLLFSSILRDIATLESSYTGFLSLFAAALNVNGFRSYSTGSSPANTVGRSVGVIEILVVVVVAEIE